jgi:predicted small secreted protein
MRHVPSGLILSLLSMTLLSGCATMAGAPDKISISNAIADAKCTSQNAKPLARIIENPLCSSTEWGALGENAQATRNELVAYRMFLIEEQYNSWKNQLVNETRVGNFTTLLASLGLSGAGAVLEPGKTSRTLAALSTALTGAKQGYDKEILLDRTLQILITQMDSSRAKIEQILIKRMSTPYKDWPIGLVMRDLADYADAGTLSAALSAVAENAAVEKKENEKKAELAVITTEYDASKAATALQDYLTVDDSKYATRSAKFAQALKDIGANDVQTADFAMFAYGKDKRKRDLLIRLIVLEKDNAEALATLVAGLDN